MENIMISKKNKAFLLLLLFMLNVTIRIPSVPHEKGIDSFFLHSLAVSLSVYGEARWWISSYSIFGFFPFSYPSSTPFSLSGIEQVANVSMEHSILLYCIFLGLFSMFSIYIFAGILYNDFLFKYAASMFFSLSQAVLTFTTWEISERAVFFIFFPIYSYLLLNDKISILKKVFLLLILIIFLFATHHFAYFLIPALIAYLCLNLIKKSKIKRLAQQGNYVYLIMLIIALTAPFFTGLFMEGGSRYGYLMDVFIVMARWVGPLVFFIISGSIFLVLKKEKSLNEWYILTLLLVFTPMVYSQIYGKYLLIPIVIIMITISFINIARIDTKKKKSLQIFILLVLLMTSAYSSFFNHARLGMLSDSSSYWYMSDETYLGGNWAKNFIPEESHAIGPSGLSGVDSLNSRRFSAVAEGHFIIPTAGAVDLAYGLVNKSDISYVENSYLSPDFYFDGPFVSHDEQSLIGGTDWIFEQREVNDKKIVDMLNSMSVDYIFEPTDHKYNIMPTVYNTKDRIYDSGAYRIHLV